MHGSKHIKNIGIEWTTKNTSTTVTSNCSRSRRMTVEASLTPAFDEGTAIVPVTDPLGISKPEVPTPWIAVSEIADVEEFSRTVSTDFKCQSITTRASTATNVDSWMLQWFLAVIPRSLTRASQEYRRPPPMPSEDPQGAPGSKACTKQIPKGPKGPWAAPGGFKSFRRTQGSLKGTWGAPGSETLTTGVLRVPVGAWGALGEFAEFRWTPRDPREPWGAPGTYARIVKYSKKLIKCKQ